MAEVRGGSEKALSQESYGLLAQANLMRVRGQWDEAVALCTKAMERDPDNASVHSMLGDIYENQGKLDEAVRWYNLALDKNPSSPADRLKLRHIAQELEHNAISEAPGLLREEAWATEAPHRPDRSKSIDHKTLTVILRVSAYLLAAAFAVAVAYALSIPMPHGIRNSQFSNSSSMPTTSLVLQPDSPQSPTTALPRDAAEQTLLTALSADVALTSNGISVVDVSDDPRSTQVTITALYAPVDAAAPTQTDILRAALRTAMETSSRTDATSAATFTVRILVQNANTQSDSLTFAGDIPRASLLTIDGDPDAMPVDQLATKFTNPWWAPGVSS